MTDRRMVQFHKLAAAMLALLLFVMVFFASCFIAAEAGHDCTGENCPVCACLQLCEQTLEQIGDGILSLCAVLIPVSCCFALAEVTHPVLLEETPVSFKVRLNN